MEDVADDRLIFRALRDNEEERDDDDEELLEWDIRLLRNFDEIYGDLQIQNHILK